MRRALGRLLLGVSRPFLDLTVAERVVLLGVAVLHVVAITWGLPASDAWEVDGIAPRDVLAGVIKTYTPGSYFTYPPLHLILLSILSLPISLVAISKAPSLARADVIATFIGVPYMTGYSLVARVVSALMSLGIVLTLGRISAAIFGPRARVWTIAFAGVEVAGAYYAHTSNLDVPALFWAVLALHALAETVRADEPRGLRKVAVFAACAVATKDQAYAVFALTLPFVGVSWLLVRRDNARAIVREAAWCALIVGGLVLLIDGALFNPSGFAERVRFLTGHASQDYAMYSKDTAGRMAALRDAVLFFDHHYPVVVAPFVVLGVLLGLRRNQGLARVGAAIPLLGILSFTLAFNCVARRIEERFMLPQMQLCAVYAGGAVAVLLDAAGRWRVAVWGIRVAATASIVLGIRLTASMLATMIEDPRYRTEQFLRENVRPGDVIEVYGNNVYLPRFPEGAHVERVGPKQAPSPLPNVIEREELLSAIDGRRPRFIVVSTGWAWRFMGRPASATEGGHILPNAQAAILADEDSTTYVRRLFLGDTGYRVAYHAFYRGHGTLLPARHLHASLASDVFVFERK